MTGAPRSYKWELLVILWVAYFINQGDRQILVRYAPIETYQRQGNLRFVLKGGAWQMQGDDYKCWNEFKAVTDQVLVGYQQAALQRVLIRNRYSTTAQAVSPSCVTMHARRF